MSLSVLVHFLLFNIYLTYLLVKMVLSAVLKFSNSIISLFFTSLTSRIFIVLLFLTRTHILFNNFLTCKNFIKNYVNRYPSHLIYDTNLFNNNFNLFYMFLTNFSSSVEFAICSGVPLQRKIISYGVQSSNLQYKSLSSILYGWRSF